MSGDVPHGGKKYKLTSFCDCNVDRSTSGHFGSVSGVNRKCSVHPIVHPAPTNWLRIQIRPTTSLKTVNLALWTNIPVLDYTDREVIKLMSEMTETLWYPNTASQQLSPLCLKCSINNCLVQMTLIDESSCSVARWHSSLAKWSKAHRFNLWPVYCHSHTVTLGKSFARICSSPKLVPAKGGVRYAGFYAETCQSSGGSGRRSWQGNSQRRCGSVWFIISERNSLLFTPVASLIDTRLFTVYTCSFTVLFTMFHISSYYVSLLYTLIHIVLSILS